jgi:hypothetical protein
MLLGAELHIHTDHKNILNIGDSSERCLRWISYVDKYSHTLHYGEGPLNVIADLQTPSHAFRVSTTRQPLWGRKPLPKTVIRLVFLFMMTSRHLLSCTFPMSDVS